MENGYEPDFNQVEATKALCFQNAGYITRFIMHANVCLVEELANRQYSMDFVESQNLTMTHTLFLPLREAVRNFLIEIKKGESL